MKILTIVGARPQLIKIAMISRELRKRHTEILIHTGQHYDNNLSAIFFHELGISNPDYNLAVGSASHGKQTGEMLSAIESVLFAENPDLVMVYGDTNSTLAGALAASKLYIKLAHVEAGLRSFNRSMPEEINRVLTDHISDLLFCPSQSAIDNLLAEGINEGLHLVGDVMHDALLLALKKDIQKPKEILGKYHLKEKDYLLVTIHRAENTDDPQRLSAIMEALNEINRKILWPIHPRTRKKLQEYGLKSSGHIQIIEPVGYYEMLFLQRNSSRILTDSGGIQKEAYWLKVPCITLRDETEWVETVQAGWNILTGANTKKICDAVQDWDPPETHPPIYGDGNTVQRIVSILSKYQRANNGIGEVT